MAFKFKVTLFEVTDPPVWRRILVPEDLTFYKLHKVIQTAFGWNNTHLFLFSPKGYGYPNITLFSPDLDNGQSTDCKKIKLNQIFSEPREKYTYIYDFGDNWHHNLVLEEITTQQIAKPDCLDGRGRCPPEDCHGPSGYAELKEIMKFAGHDDYEEMREWLKIPPGHGWDADKFDLEKTRKKVQKI